MLKIILDIITSKKIYLPLLLIATGVLTYQLISKTINKVNKINIKYAKAHSIGYDKRKSTVVGLINNIIKYIIAIIIIILILDIYGVNTEKLVASIGVASLVIGLAFQDIIKNFLSGVFMVFDNAYAVGDWITINGFKGEVISMGLQNTKIKAYTGEVKTINNSTITEVINYNLSNQTLFLQIPIAYETNLETAEEVLRNILAEIRKEKNVKGTELLGIEEFGSHSIDYSISITCKAGTQFPIKRKILRNIKVAFDKKGIIIPYNQIDVHIEK